MTTRAQRKRLASGPRVRSMSRKRTRRRRAMAARLGFLRGGSVGALARSSRAMAGG